MEKNVGRTDQMLRGVIGPLLMVAGYDMWNGKKGRLLGLSVMGLGWLISETARTRSCPVNELLGVDTARSPSDPPVRISRVDLQAGLETKLEMPRQVTAPDNPPKEATPTVSTR